MSDAPKKRKLPRKTKVALWIAGLLLGYTLVGFFLMPAIIKSQLLKRLPALTHRQAAIRQVTLNPFNFALTLRGLSLTESNGAAFAGWDEFHVQFQAMSSLSHRAWVFRDVTLTHPFAHVIRRKDGSFNFDNLAETNATTTSAPASALPSMLVQNLRVLGADLEADDLTGATTFRDKIAPIDLQLSNFTTLSNTASPFAFAAVTDAGEKFEASGQITLQPLQSSGSIKISAVDLKRYGPYAAAFTTAQVTDGKVDVAAKYHFALDPHGPDATVTNGAVQLTNFRVKSPDTGETVVSIPSLAVNLEEASLARSAVHVSSIKSSGGSLLVRQNHDGTINLLTLISHPSSAGTPPPLAPYLPSEVRLALSKGQLSIHARAQGALGTDGPACTFSGDVSFTNVATADLRHDRDMVKFDALTVKGIKASYPAIKLQIEEVALAGLKANVVIYTNQQINLATIYSNSAPKAAAAPAASSAPPALIDLGTLVIDKASFHYVDESIEPRAAFDVQELSGTIKGLSSHAPGPATVELRGDVDAFSPYSISGSIDPLAKDISLNLALSIKNVDLTSLTPYMEKYGGYPLNKGKVLMQLKYDLARRKLAASNKVIIADLTLGAKNNSPAATHLPVKLGVALLKDREGKIDLEVPLSGSLDDPNFRIGPLIMQVVENLLAKAATSPFTLLGRALGGGGEELSSVDFAPGEAVVAPSEKSKLAKLAKALYERPALTLQIAGACAPAVDGPFLARQHLQRRINKIRADEEAAAGKPVQSVESIKLAPTDYARLLKKLYKRTFRKSPANQATSAASNISTLDATAPSSTVAKLANGAPAPEASRQVGGNYEKGGEKLMQHEADQRAPLLAPTPAPAALAPAPLPTPLVANSAPDLAQMEQRLISEIYVTDDELPDLEQMRARAVQSALLESGQIKPERVFVLAPKPIDAAAPGEARANFSLE